jgi:hypothetical protein
MSLPAEAPVRAFVIGPIGDKDAQVGSEARVSFEEAVQVLEEVIFQPVVRLVSMQPES